MHCTHFASNEGVEALKVRNSRTVDKITPNQISKRGATFLPRRRAKRWQQTGSFGPEPPRTNPPRGVFSVVGCGGVCNMWPPRMSETPTTTASQKSIAICLQFLLQDASNLYWSTFGALLSEEREILSVLLPFVSQYASHLYCNTL